MLPDPLKLSGTTLAEKYAIESVVGEGGYAIVYRAMHLVWKRPVAIKVFRTMGSFSAKKREQLVEDFVREGKVLSELSERSAAFVQARDIGTITSSDGLWMPYMVLEWLEGESLEAVLDKDIERGSPPRAVDEAMRLLDPVAEALSLAHKRGIAHRDVKPANVFILGDPRADCTVKILDFGIAKVVADVAKSEGAFDKTQGSASFTPAYGAPEQFSRQYGGTGPWTDVFALALIFVEMITHKIPLDGDDIAQLGFASLDPNRRPTPRSFGVQVSDALEMVLTRALAVNPEQRYRSMEEFWSAMRGAVRASTSRTESFVAPMPAPFTQGDRPSFAQAPNPMSSSQPMARPVDITRSAPQEGARGNGAAVVVIAAVLGVLLLLGVGAGALMYRLNAKKAALIADARAHDDAMRAAAASASALALSAVPAKPTCPSGMMEVPGGKFFMGSDDKRAFDFEKPAHQVMLKPYCIDRFEATTKDYKSCSDSGECKRASQENEWDGITDKDRKAFDPLCNIRDPEGRGEHPINCVDWDLSTAFCTAKKKRLPTEAEWEYATRGSDGRTYPWGDDAPTAKHLNACGTECVLWGKKNGVEEHAMYGASDGFANTAPVGSFPMGKSPFGVEDVVGNVWEWVSDWYAPYEAGAKDDPTGPSTGDERVIRGGAWNGAEPSWVRPTFRYHDAPSKRSYGIGFRCAKDL